MCCVGCNCSFVRPFFFYIPDSSCTNPPHTPSSLLFSLSPYLTLSSSFMLSHSSHPLSFPKSHIPPTLCLSLPPPLSTSFPPSLSQLPSVLIFPSLPHSFHLSSTFSLPSPLNLPHLLFDHLPPPSLPLTNSFPPPHSSLPPPPSLFPPPLYLFYQVVLPLAAEGPKVRARDAAREHRQRTGRGGGRGGRHASRGGMGVIEEGEEEDEDETQTENPIHTRPRS